MAASPVAALLRSAAAAAVSLGAIHSLAGATTTVASPVSPLSAKVGTAISGVAFGVTGLRPGDAPSSWTVSGAIPPGLNFQGRTSTPTTVNVTTQNGTAIMSGTPTTAGTYTMTVQAFESPNASGAATPALNYTVVVSAGNAPAFTAQPQSQTVNVGQQVTFTSTSTGTPSPTFQWQKDSTAIAGANGASYTIPIVQLSDAGNYTVVATNNSGSTTSVAATLTVLDPNLPPAFTMQPLSQTVTVGTAVAFNAAASGSPSYQWQKNGVPLSDNSRISGSTTGTLSFSSPPGVQASDAGTYTIVATNSHGSASKDATLTVNAAPFAPYIPANGSPVAQTIANGTTVTFKIIAVGNPSPTYQWQKDTVNISGATSSTLVLTGATFANAGTYTCVATNSMGSVTSLGAALTVVSITNPGRLVNLSILTAIQDSMTLGFVVGGTGVSGNQSLLIRAVGPTLGAPASSGGFGYPGVMPDPSMTVIRQNDKAALYTNTGWKTASDGGTAALNTAAATGAFPLINPSLDSAVVASVPAVTGGYSVQIKGSSNDSGSVIAEIYDNTPNYTATSPRLVNISSLKQIASGTSLTLGFVLGGSTSKTVLIRAAGPALIGFGYSSSAVMADPKIVLQQQNNGAVLATNAGWGGDAQIGVVGDSVGAFKFTDPASKDSAVVLTLPPVVGGYSATVSSASGGGGNVIVEVYEVP